MFRRCLSHAPPLVRTLSFLLGFCILGRFFEPRLLDTKRRRIDGRTICTRFRKHPSKALVHVNLEGGKEYADSQMLVPFLQGFEGCGQPVIAARAVCGTCDIKDKWIQLGADIAVVSAQTS